MDGGDYQITIPPRGLPPLLIAGVVVLAGNLLLVLYTGIMLLLARRSVLFMAQISPHDLPVSMHPLRLFLVLALLGIEVLGGWLLLLIVRPSLTRERHRDRRATRSGTHRRRWGGRRFRSSPGRTCRGFICGGTRTGWWRVC